MSSPVKNHRTNGAKKKKARIPTATETTRLEATIRLLEMKNSELQEELIRTKAPSCSPSPASSPSNDVAEPVAPRTRTPLLALQEIRLRQSRGFVDELSPREPFFVQARLRLPHAPSSGSLEADGDSYEVRVVVKGVGEVAAESVADDLTPGVLDYESVIPMPGLEPGSYSMSVYAIVPFARIGERKGRPIVVGR